MCDSESSFELLGVSHPQGIAKSLTETFLDKEHFPYRNDATSIDANLQADRGALPKDTTVPTPFGAFIHFIVDKPGVALSAILARLRVIRMTPLDKPVSLGMRFYSDHLAVTGCESFRMRSGCRAIGARIRGATRVARLAGMVLATLATITVSRDARSADIPIAPKGTTVGQAASTKSARTMSEEVFFVTNRKPTHARDLARQFSSDRAEAVSAGCVHVSMAVAGANGASETKSMTLISASELPVALREDDEGRKNVIAVIHGYNSTFDGAVRAAAKLKRDIRTKANVLVVSWTSQGWWKDYFQDENEVEWANDMLYDTLLQLLKSPLIDRVQLIAHSLGSRALVRVLRRIFDSPERDVLAKISEIAFAAPDIERDIMDRDFVPITAAFRIPTAIYVSDPDVWIIVSEFFNGRPRVASLSRGTIYIRKGIATIDVSAVDGTLTGHSVFFVSAYIANDLHYFFNHHLPPKERYWLHKINVLDGKYWRLENR
jgi:esterase/lipase superfamily enzyme